MKYGNITTTNNKEYIAVYDNSGLCKRCDLKIDKCINHHYGLNCSKDKIVFKEIKDEDNKS